MDVWQKYCVDFVDLRKNIEQPEGVNPQQIDLLKLLFKCLESDADIYLAVASQDISKLPRVKHLDHCRDVNQYCDSISTVLKYEELRRRIEIRQFDQYNKKLTAKYDHEGKLESYGIIVPGIHNLPIDHIILQSVDPHYFRVAALKISMIGDCVTLQQTDEPLINGILSHDLNMFFFSSGQSFDAAQEAIERLRRIHNLYEIIRPNERKPGAIKIESINVEQTNTVALKERLNKLDERQRSGVIAILQAKCGRFPYIITGPPGSGKTRMLIESVVQIYNRAQSFKVLVCASSGTCVDLLYYQLLENGITQGDILRLRSHDPYYVFSYQRIIVTTNNDSIGIYSRYHRQPRFDYIFIDEANHAPEYECLMPISSIQHGGRLVLCGDPELLNPSDELFHEAHKFGVNRPLLHRLLSKQIQYRLEPSDVNFITRLNKFYRSDKNIMQPTLYKTFTHGPIEFSEQTPKSILKLLRFTGPVEYLHVVNQEFVPGWATAITNESEANACVKTIIDLYKIGLEPSQIGVISPFKLQVELIRLKLASAITTHESLLSDRFPAKPVVAKTRRCLNALENRYWMCKIDTPTGFQGDEREVIIISPKFSNDPQYGKIVNDRSSFNLAISRAKWLLIFIGELDLLKRAGYVLEPAANAYLRAD